MSFRRLLITLGLIIALASTASAATTYWTAATGGTTTSSCATASGSEPPGSYLRTIAAGIACLTTAGDTLKVRNGTYSERINRGSGNPNGTSGAPITVEAEHRRGVLWQVPSTNVEALIFNGDWWIFRGFVFDGQTGRNCLHHHEGVCGNPSPGANPYTRLTVSYTQQLVGLGRQNNLIEDNEFVNSASGAMIINDNGGVSTGNIFRNNYVHRMCKVLNCNILYIRAANTTVEGNTFEDMASGIAFWKQEDPPNVNNGIIRNNTFRRVNIFWAPTAENGNHSQGTVNGGARWPQGEWNQAGAAIFISRGSNQAVYNNLIIDSAGGINASNDASNCKIYHNTYSLSQSPQTSLFGVVGSHAGISITDDGGAATGCEVKNNIVHQPGITNPPPLFANVSASFAANMCSAGSAGGLGCTVDDPQFASSAGGNFQLAAGSHAVNVGLDLSSACPGCVTDIVGTPRPAGQWHLGAFQQGAPVNPDPVTLLGWWKLDEGSGTTATDSSGNGHAGALDIAAWGPGILFPSAFTPTGTQEITVANLTGLNLTGSFSIVAWIRMTEVDTGGCAILSNQEAYSLYLSSTGVPQGWLWNGTAYEHAHGSVSVLSGTNRMLAVTYDQGVSSPAIRLYIGECSIKD